MDRGALSGSDRGVPDRVFGDVHETTEEETNCAAAWFLQDRELSVGGTPLERYALDGPDPALRALAAPQAPAKLGLWRVIDATPGQSMLLEPYAGGAQVRVASTNLSTIVGPWNLILGRLRPDAMVLWGPSRCYAAGDEQALRHVLERLAHRLDVDPDDVDQIARRTPAELYRFRPPEPVPFTTEGDPVVFVKARWRVDPDTAADALARAESLRPEGTPDSPSYGWLADRSELLGLKPDTLPPGVITFESNPIGMPDAVALGSLFLDRNELRYEGIPSDASVWALGMVAEMLPDAKLIDVDTKEAADGLREQRARRTDPPQVPPEVIADLRASMTERWLSGPIPALEGLSPRQAAANGAYRPQLRSLLRQIAAHSRNKLAIDIDAVTADLGISP